MSYKDYLEAFTWLDYKSYLMDFAAQGLPEEVWADFSNHVRDGRIEIRGVNDGRILSSIDDAKRRRILEEPWFFFQLYSTNQVALVTTREGKGIRVSFPDPWDKCFGGPFFDDIEETDDFSTVNSEGPLTSESDREKEWAAFVRAVHDHRVAIGLHPELSFQYGNRKTGIAILGCSSGCLLPIAAVVAGFKGEWVISALLLLGALILWQIRNWLSGLALRFRLLDDRDMFEEMYYLGRVTVRKNSGDYRYVFRHPEDWRRALNETDGN